MKKIEEIDFNSLKTTIDTLDNDRKVLCNSLLNELVFMKMTLEELKDNVNKEGVITDMCQGKYSIKRGNPALNHYNTLIKNYSSCIKQLNELLPKELNTTDDLDDFLND